MTGPHDGERPDARALLEQARRSLREDVLPGLSGAARYQALMIGNALGIAARELAAGQAPWLALAESLRGLPGFPPEGEGREAGGAALSRRLAGEIRAGRWDGDAALHAILRDHVAARLAVTNPKAVPPDAV